MGTGLTGTFVISWSQTELDGLDAAPLAELRAGRLWGWRGEAVCVDRSDGSPRPGRRWDDAALRRQAACRVRRLVASALKDAPGSAHLPLAPPDFESSFVLSNGAQRFVATVIEVAPGEMPLLMFLGQLPPRDTDLWVESGPLAAQHGAAWGAGSDVGLDAATGHPARGTICFTPGTSIATPHGPRRVEDLREGDRVRTRDSGDQEILWTGCRRMTGARLLVMPELRPIRFGIGALGIERPDQTLLVSPGHRMLVRGSLARSLFGTSEVLVRAADLVNGTTVTVDDTLRETSYVHLLLAEHQILWANGVETESFHPANAALSTLGAGDRERLLAGLPWIEHDPHDYGDFARRNLSPSEAAVLMSAVA